MKSITVLSSSALSLALAATLLSSCSSLPSTSPSGTSSKTPPPSAANTPRPPVASSSPGSIKSTKRPSAASPSAPSKKGDAGYITPGDTYSPDHRYGVMILVFHEDDPASDPRRNQVVELKSKQVVAEIPGDDPSYNRTLNHHDMGIASWSKDSSLLLWDVEGKWSPDLLSLVNLEGGKARWKLDVLKTAQREILRRTREAKPERYAAAKKENVGWGSAYPEGFNVDVVASVGEGDPVSLPLAFKVDLSANPKGVEDYPTNLDSYMDMIVKEDGTFFVKSFKLGKRPGGNGR